MSERIGGVQVQRGEMRHHGFSTTIYQYTCAVCGQPGTDNRPNTTTHPGECRREAKRRNDERSKQRRKGAA